MQESAFVRPTEIILILLSIVIMLLAGFGPLFDSPDRSEAVAQECRMFYGSSGPSAVARCMAEMAPRAGATR